VTRLFYTSIIFLVEHPTCSPERYLIKTFQAKHAASDESHLPETRAYTPFFDFWVLPGPEAYATSKQCNLATVLSLARERPRLHFKAVEPGISPATGLGRDASVFLRFLAKYVLGVLAPFIKYGSTPKRAAPVITKVPINGAGQTGVYYDDGGQPMLGSTLVRDSKFTDHIVAETRALLSTVPI
jgi:hypothetical protein